MDTSVYSVHYSLHRGLDAPIHSPVSDGSEGVANAFVMR